MSVIQVLPRHSCSVVSPPAGHADYNDILAWLTGFNKPPEMTFIVHGEPESSQAMAGHIKDKLGWDVTIPEFGQGFELNL